MNEYAIHAKVKNNLILRRIFDGGYRNVSEFCRRNGLGDSEVGLLINMREPAVRPDGAWTFTARKLADALGVMPDDLFTAEQMTARLQRNEAYIEMSRQEALTLLDDGTEYQHALENTDLVGKLMGAANLNANQRIVLQLRFIDELTLDEIGERLDLTKERVRQIQMTALRNIRKASSAVLA